MEKIRNNNILSTKQIAIIGMLSSISIFLGLSGLGFIPIPPVKATIMHIPVIIGAIIEGPIVGSLVGLVFGLFSMYQNITNVGPTSFIFWNPIIAILPRILIAIVSYYVYTILKEKSKNKSIPIVLASLLGSATNTIGVLSLAYIIYFEKFIEVLKLKPETAIMGITTIGFTNGIPEAIISALISVSVISSVFKFKR